MKYNDIPVIAAIIAFLIVVSVGTCCYYYSDYVTTTTGDLDNLKQDCYARGFADGKVSVLPEENGERPIYLGIPEGYTSNRSSGWKTYADSICNSTCYRKQNWNKYEAAEYWRCVKRWGCEMQ